MGMNHDHMISNISSDVHPILMHPHICWIFLMFLRGWTMNITSSSFSGVKPQSPPDGWSWKRLHSSYGAFLKWGYPQSIHANRIFHYKPSIFGYHHLWKPSCLPQTSWSDIQLCHKNAYIHRWTSAVGGDISRFVTHLYVSPDYQALLYPSNVPVPRCCSHSSCPRRHLALDPVWNHLWSIAPGSSWSSGD